MSLFFILWSATCTRRSEDGDSVDAARAFHPRFSQFSKYLWAPITCQALWLTWRSLSVDMTQRLPSNIYGPLSHARHCDWLGEVYRWTWHSACLQIPSQSRLVKYTSKEANRMEFSHCSEAETQASRATWPCLRKSKSLHSIQHICIKLLL